MDFIVNFRTLLKRFLWVIFCGFFFIVNCGFQFPPQISEKLAALPFIGRYFQAPEDLKELKDQASQALQKAFLAGAKVYAPQSLEQAQQFYQRGLAYLKQEKTSWAKKAFEKAVQLAHKAEEEAKKEREERKKRCLEKYNSLLKESKRKDNLELQLRLRYLRGLIEQERFEEFEREYLALKKNLSKY